VLRGWQQLGHKAVGIPLAGAAFLGTYLGIWFQQVGFKYAPAGIAQTLLATSPIFILGMARLAGQKVSLQSWVGSAIALVGVSLLLILG
jgi:drug/metabolite transporter (DMT)-like permease